MATICVVLVGILALSAVILNAGQQDAEARPEAASSSPSGVAAFVGLLRERGIPYSVDTNTEPDLKPGDIPVAFRLVDSNTKLSEILTKQSQKCTEKVLQHVHKGGTALILPLRQDFLEASRSTLKTPADPITLGASSQKLSITQSGISADQSFSVMDDDEEDSTAMDLWGAGPHPFLRAYRSGNGTVFIASDAIGITNRFIDKSDNAEAFGRIFSMAAASGKRIVFTEASFGHIYDRGLLESIGPWANAAWQQLLILGIVIAFTLGKRFGLPEETKRTQRGSRELLDAIADTYQRAGTTQTALLNAYRDADSDLRTVLKLSKDSPRTDRDKHLPESLQKALARLEVGSEMTNMTQEQGLSLIKNAHREIDAFLGPKRPRARGLAKL